MIHIKFPSFLEFEKIYETAINEQPVKTTEFVEGPGGTSTARKIAYTLKNSEGTFSLNANFTTRHYVLTINDKDILSNPPIVGATAKPGKIWISNMDRADKNYPNVYRYTEFTEATAALGKFFNGAIRTVAGYTAGELGRGFANFVKTIITAGAQAMSNIAYTAIIELYNKGEAVINFEMDNPNDRVKFFTAMNTIKNAKPKPVAKQINPVVDTKPAPITNTPAIAPK